LTRIQPRSDTPAERPLLLSDALRREVETSYGHFAQMVA
jgi:hypothetical protein